MLTPRPQSRPESVVEEDLILPPTAQRAATSSADLILPMLIFATVHANPHRLISTLRYVERYRSEWLMRGEASYCLTNALASVEFLLTVDLASLSDSTITIAPSPVDAAPPAPIALAQARQLRGNVSSLAAAAGKGLVGIAEGAISGGRLIGGLLSKQPATLDDVRDVLSGGSSPPLLRRASTPLLAAQNADSNRNRSISEVVRPAREMVDVSTPDEQRPSIGDRLASLARLRDGPRSLRSPSIISTDIEAPPISRFMTTDDLKLSDVALLLADYRRLAAALERRGAFGVL